MAKPVLTNPCALIGSFSVFFVWYFCLGAKPANSQFVTKTAKKKIVNIVILHSETTRKS